MQRVPGAGVTGFAAKDASTAGTASAVSIPQLAYDYTYGFRCLT
ncbi:MAG: hypothetical protein WDN06_19910 [Asticcacaulis sp.]